MAIRRRRNVWDLVVIGGGLAGLTAAWHASRRGLSVALFESQPLFGGLIATVNVLDDWPAVGVASGVELTLALVEKLRAEQIQIFNEPVTTIDAGHGSVTIQTPKQFLNARRVIVATGAVLKPMSVPGEESLRGRGISQCAYCDGGFFKDQDVVVVGGGSSALQQALVLSQVCRQVTIVARSSLRAKRMLVERAIGKTNVRFLWEREITAILGEESVTGVEITDVKGGSKEKVLCSGVFPFVGLIPNSQLLPHTISKDGDGAIITDAQFRTTEPKVFAVGAVRSGYGGDLVNAVGEVASAVAAVHSELQM